MPPVRPGTPTADEEPDRFGFDQSRSYITEYLGKFVPAAAARRAVSVSVETDRETYALGDPVEVTVTFTNRLPLPIVVPTPKRRLWGWTVDDELEASDERRYTRETPSAFEFGARETKRTTFVWDGRLERTDDRHEWVLPDRGDHEIAAFLATADRRPRDSTTVTIR